MSSAAATAALSATSLAWSHGRPHVSLRARALTSAHPAPRASRKCPAVRAAASADAAAVEPDGPTQVPRAKGVQDGEWNDLDARLVEQSQSDARATYERSILTAAPTGTTKTALAADDLLKSSAVPEFNLLGLTLSELKTFAAENGLPAFRGKQLRDHLYGVTPARTVDDLTTLPKNVREALKKQNVAIGRSAVHHVAAAADGTCKLLLRLGDDRVVETVGIPATENGKHRLTACVSSQVGCPMRCTFCATGKGGFARNLAPHEIVDQVISLEEHFGKRVTNVVFMGMGEPLLNIPNVLRAHDALNREVGIGARHITISTVGVRGSLEKLAAARLQSTLAVSLHAPNQELRESLIPSAKAYPLNDLLDDCEQYFVATGRRVTFEYTLLAGVNDSPEHAEALARVLYTKKLASHVNLIPYNTVDDAEQYQRPTRAAVHEFRDILEEMNVPASIRQTRGLEAAAACGQLRNAFQKDPIASI
jgi:23S rRNA (adenine2503-C2)-methyltransferase